jgi:hypothetical protein
VGAGCLCLVAALLAAPPARAQALKDNRYAIDLFQGPVLAPSDVIGIAGAYAGYAEGIAGMVANAAAPAVREPFSVGYLNWDISGSVSLPIKLFANDDFDNSGSIDHDFSNFIYVTGGALFQYGPFGVGVNAELQRYSLTPTNGRQGAADDVTIGKYHALAAFRLLGDQVMVGGGARIATLGLGPRNQERSLTMIGVAPEFGVLVRPDWQSFRVGATLRLPVHGGQLLGGTTTRADGVKTAGGLILPDDVVLPWELELGAAVQVGPRPLNPVWIDPRAQEEAVRASFARRREARRRARQVGEVGDAEEAALEAKERDEEERQLRRLAQERRARYWNWPRQHLLLTVELLMTGPVDGGVSVQRFLGQGQADRDRSLVGSSGSSVNFSPRFGVETEPIPDLIHTRTGSYYEPSRLADRVGRQHFTFGADVRLFSTTWFGLVPRVTYKAQAYADFSPRYQSVSLGIGVWR